MEWANKTPLLAGGEQVDQLSTTKNRTSLNPRSNSHSYRRQQLAVSRLTTNPIELCIVLCHSKFLVSRLPALPCQVLVPATLGPVHSTKLIRKACQKCPSPDILIELHDSDFHSGPALVKRIRLWRLGLGIAFPNRPTAGQLSHLASRFGTRRLSSKLAYMVASFIWEVKYLKPMVIIYIDKIN